LLETLLLLVQIFYDLNSQDLPEYFEDNIGVFMPLLHKHLTASYPTIPDPPADDEDADETLHERVRAAICEAVELYATRYTEEFTDLDRFVETVWTVLTKLGTSRRYDAVRFDSLIYLRRSG
jgi:exportin-2 (importin alpha re-exporter)